MDRVFIIDLIKTIDAARDSAIEIFEKEFDMEFTISQLHQKAVEHKLKKANGTKPEIYEEYRVRLCFAKIIAARQALSRTRNYTEKVNPYLRSYRLLYWSFRRIYTRNIKK